MAVRKLDRSEWHPFFDFMSKTLVGKRAEIEVASLDTGDQIEAEWLPLLGITYDPKGDVFEIALEGVDHLIRAPQTVHVDEGALGLMSMEIVDTSGTLQIIKLRDPLMLPAPSAG